MNSSFNVSEMDHLDCCLIMVTTEDSERHFKNGGYLKLEWKLSSTTK